MGCCVSSHRASVPSSAIESHCSTVASQPPRSSVSRVKASENRAPPPVEEETVKEVLSETPKWKPPITDLEPKKQTQNLFFEKTQQGRQKTDESFLLVHKVQEPETPSEVCSLSESVSTATIADKREEDEEQFPQRMYGSPANLSVNQSFNSSNREKVVGKSPSRRSEISPGRRNTGFGSGSMRFIQSRDPLNQNTIASRNPRTEPNRRDVGEQSGRRSRSPATRTDNGVPKSLVGRSPSARRTNPSPGRSRMAQVDDCGGSNVRKNEQSRRDNKWNSTNESLENPLVSLECFIFL